MKIVSDRGQKAYDPVRAPPPPLRPRPDEATVADVPAHRRARLSHAHERSRQRQPDRPAVDRCRRETAGRCEAAARRSTDRSRRAYDIVRRRRGRPAGVVFADYDCPQLCSPILALAGIALGKSGLEAGTDYRLVVIGFNPKASGADGERMVDGQIGFSSPVGRAPTAVLASEVVATRLTSAVAFHYV